MIIRYTPGARNVNVKRSEGRLRQRYYPVRARSTVILSIYGRKPATRIMHDINDLHVYVILSIDSLTATHGEQKLGSSLELGGEVCEGGEDVDRQL